MNKVVKEEEGKTGVTKVFFERNSVVYYPGSDSGKLTGVKERHGILLISEKACCC